MSGGNYARMYYTSFLSRKSENGVMGYLLYSFIITGVVLGFL